MTDAREDGQIIIRKEIRIANKARRLTQGSPPSQCPPRLRVSLSSGPASSLPPTCSTYPSPFAFMAASKGSQMTGFGSQSLRWMHHPLMPPSPPDLSPVGFTS